MEQWNSPGTYCINLMFINTIPMKKSHLHIFCILLFSSCSSPDLNSNDMFNAAVYYDHYLNEYYKSGDLSFVDSALKYNEYLLKEESAGIVEHLNQIQLLSLCNRFDSADAFINRMSDDMVVWPPEYKSYLRLKCRAIMSKKKEDTCLYIKCLDSIIILLNPVMMDSLARADTLFSKPLEIIQNQF